MPTSSKHHRAGMNRLFTLAMVVGGLSISACSGTSSEVTGARHTESPAPEVPWFAGYVDVTLPSSYEFDKPPNPEAARAVLSFIVADPENPCTPSWGGHHSMDGAASKLNLDQRITRLRDKGGEIVISFGGQLADELATGCRDKENLAAAYRSVIKRYGSNVVDLDIERDDLDDESAGRRRAEVIAQLQHERTGADPLQVWVTLPATPKGLTDHGAAAVTQMLEAGVDLAGVNIMIMNYSASRLKEQTMLEASVAAIRSTHSQLGTIYADAGQPLDASELWSQIGVTPMIGHNDVAGEVIDMAAARGINKFARNHGIGRISMWSLNRDRPCATEERDGAQPSNTCSGLGQEIGAFSRILGNGYTGSVR